ncbi:ARM repeat-containing protein [Tothia fuscella]|uniref:ARM repeat-containing protein n=1 Tax=Tothia fuscella TaxID=1048955 RepID=A0A9P4NQ91_9PEZI|nr:ARM repeat-containing protein [Tothia fuscella]
MEDQAASLLSTLKKSSIATDAKLSAFNNLKSNIKHLRVPEEAQPTIFECIRLALTSQASTTLVSSGFSTLGHLIKRLSLQEQTAVIAGNAKKFLPILLERLGDARESHRNAASVGLTEFWPCCHDLVEGVVREGAMGGNNARAKEMAMLWVVKMNQSEGLQFKSFVPQLVASLEDPDGTVRETAKGCVIDLFRNAPEHAKSDLKKRMVSQGVRKTIEAQVVSQLGIRASVDLDLAASVRSTHTTHSVAPSERSQPESNFGDSIMSEQPPQQEVVPMDPLYVDTSRELEDTFRDMLPLFEGRESEGNWSARDKNVLKIRRLLKGNAPTEFHAVFVTGIKSIMEGILKVANSLRTTVSTNGCLCVQELAKTLTTAMDPMVEILIQSFIKTCAATKKIAADNGNKTVEAILSHVSYTNRLMQHMWLSIQDKNVQTRSYASNWLTILIKKHVHQKAHIEHSGGLEVAEKFIKKGLADANPKVREGTRGTYWAFSQVWPDQAEKIMNSLDAKSRGQLEKDSRNPNTGSMASSVASLSASTNSTLRPALGASRPSVRDAILAQRKAALAAGRPTSAQASFSPVKSTSAPSANTRPGAARAMTARPPSAMSRDAMSGSHTSQVSQSSTTSSLMSAPVRRPRRPEIARPATADPYASRRAAAQQSTPTMSPNTSPQKATVKATTKTTARSPARPQAPTAASTVRSKSRMDSGIPKQTPRRPAVADSPMSSASKNEDFTMVVPFTKAPDDDQAHAAPTRRTPRLNKHMSVDSGIPTFDEDPGFTMVIPNLRNSHFEDRPSSSGSRQGTPRLSPIKSSNNSPLPMSRLRSPAVYSPERSKSPLIKVNPEPDMPPVQVYEDPFVGDETPRQGGSDTETDKPVLEELPLDGRANERALSEEPTIISDNDFSQSTRSNEQNVRTPRHHKTTSTGSVIGLNGDANGGVMADAETLRSRKLLTSGIERIRAKTLDVHGFRRVQDLVKGDQDIWGAESQRFGDLLLALLDYLETPNETLKSGSGSGGGSGTSNSSAITKVQNLKTQVLATIRAMLSIHRKEAAPYYSRALCSVLAARRQFEEAMHITSDIEKTADDIVKYGQPLDSLNAVLDMIESLNTPTTPLPLSPSSESSHVSAASSSPNSPSHTTAFTSRTIVLSLSILGSLLSAAQSRNVSVSQSQTQRLGQLALRFLHDSDSDVRRADLEFCLALFDGLGGEKGEGFWKALGGGVGEGHVNLITYYLARKGKVV